MSEGIVYVKHEPLKEYCQKLFLTQGMSHEEAIIAADGLVEANLTGVDSHGVSRMPIYIRRLAEKVVNYKSRLEVIAQHPGALVLDGCNSMGAVSGFRAMEMGITKARESGAAFVTVNNSNHFGTAAYFTKMAINQGMIGFAASNAPSTMAPWGGLEPYMGTNPFSVGVPAGSQLPIIADMATSVVAQGKIILAAKNNQEIPLGWAINKEGENTTNAQEALEGSVLPFGGPKGYAISLLIDILAGILSGAAFGPHLNNMWNNFQNPQNVGHFFIVLDISKFINLDIFKSKIDQMITEIKGSPKAKGVEEILLPGEIEYRKKQERLKDGIPITATVNSDLRELGEKWGVLYNLS